MPCIAYPLPSPEAGAQVRYVRRAVELAGDLAVPGLSRECRAYVTSHPSNAYDGPALRVFARGLLAAGQRDRAAAVYCGLLRVRLPALHALTGFRVRSVGAAVRLQDLWPAECPSCKQGCRCDGGGRGWVRHGSSETERRMSSDNCRHSVATATGMGWYFE